MTYFCRTDVELIISEVEKRPVIWDVTHEGYKDKNNKNEAWDEICCALFSDYTNKTKAEQIVITQDINSKWRSVRDNYVRSLKKQSELKPGFGVNRRSGYIYERHLTFLKKAREARPPDDNIVPFDIINVKEEVMNHQNSNNIDDVMAGFSAEEPINNLNLSTSSNPPAAKKAKKGNFEDRLINILELSSHEKTWADYDEDVAFFTSLIPTVKSLNNTQKLQFRIQVMQLLQQMKQE